MVKFIVIVEAFERQVCSVLFKYLNEYSDLQHHHFSITSNA